MLVAKFGGSCMLSRNLSKVNSVVNAQHKVIVVSASGKNYEGDTKVTDLLLEWHNSGYNSTLFAPIAYRYQIMCREHAIKIDINALLSDAYNRCLIKKELPYTLSIGEEICARIIACYLNRQYLEAEKIIKFKGDKCDMRVTMSAVKKAVQDELYVMGGFYGGDGNTRKVFSRGGGDVTGALVARAINATMYENWTDVDGVCVANPRKISLAKSLPCVSYRDMYILAKNGAEVLHPDSIKPLAKVAIPIHIRNIYNPFSCGTLVQNQSHYDSVIGVTDRYINNAWRTVVVCNNNLANAMCAVLSCLRDSKTNLIELHARHNYCIFVTDKQILQQVCQALLLTPSDKSITI